MTKPFFAYRSFWKEPEAKRRFAELGVTQFCVFAGHSTNSLGEPYSQTAPTWLWYDTYDFTPLDEQIEDTLRIQPDAQILCMADLNSPLWLARQLHIDSYCEAGSCLCHEKWRTETEKYLRAFVDHTEKKYGNRILCYILMCGKTDEWMDHAFGKETADTLRVYTAWCRRNNLPDPEDVPTEKQRTKSVVTAGNCRILDPEKSSAAIQYWRFRSELIAEGIERFAGIVRSLVPAERQTGVFYGYQLEIAQNSARMGHLAYEKLERSDVLDFVISPGDYQDREMGGGSGFMTPNGTVHRHGKGCLYEIDHRTTTANMQLTPYVCLSWMSAWQTPAEDAAGLRREFCRTLFHGASLWWFDMWGGFFGEKHQLETIRRCRELWEEYAESSATEPEAEVVMVVDPASGLLFTGEDCNRKLYHAQFALNRMGAPFRICTMNDLEAMPDTVRLAVFASTAQITPEQRAMLGARIFPQIKCIWCGPCGVTDGKTMKQQELPGLQIADPGALTPEILRAEAAKAGVHLFTEIPAVVWYGRDLLMVHTASGGKLNLALPRKYRQAEELFTGKTYPVGGKTFTADFAAPDTLLFRLQK